MSSQYSGNQLCLNEQNCSQQIPSGSDKLVGWVQENGGRGTLTLLWTCLFTTFLCTWVVNHPRVDKRKHFRVLHKLVLTFKAFIAPELIAVEGAQEWTQARWLVAKCAALTNDEFKLVHAFYIGMFGIRYRTPDGSRVLWPNQFAWLLEQGLFRWESRTEWSLTRESIKDKSNADGTTKLFAICQAGWFVAQSIIRAAYHLPLAPLESMTLSYIPLFGLTYLFWWFKPKDIETPSEIDLPPMSDEEKDNFESMAISSDFDNEGAARQTSIWMIWYLTPRVFEREVRDRELREAIEMREQHIQRLERKGLPLLRRAQPLATNAENTITLAHWDPNLYHSKLWPVTCLFGISFPALHLISWDGTFPTYFELWLWRGSSILSIVTMLIFMQFERLTVQRNKPWTFVKVVPPALYILSRVVMLGEAFAAFRASNPAIYESRIVTNSLLHVS